MHKPEHIKEFDTASGDLRAALDAVSTCIEETLLPAITAARIRTAACDATVARLRRAADHPDDMGTLNSVSAVQSRHRALGAGLEALNQAALHLLDVERELRLLHPSVVSALAERQAP